MNRQDKIKALEAEIHGLQVELDIKRAHYNHLEAEIKRLEGLRTHLSLRLAGEKAIIFRNVR